MKNHTVRNQAPMKPLLRSLSTLTQATIALAVFPAGHALAQTTPGAGQLIQQVPQPQAPATQTPGLTIQQPPAAQSASSAPFMVRTIEITGNTVFPTSVLKPLVAEGEGKTITLGQLDALANRITQYYRTRGYPLTRAIIPAQTLSNGTVRLQVLETRYGQVKLDNTSKVKTATLSSVLGPIQAGQLLTQDSLDRALLLLSDYPGAAVSATLSPGQAVGTTDLNVKATPTNRVVGNVFADTYGSKYTGRARLGANVDINNLLGRGDTVSLTGLTSMGGLDYARAAYQMPVGSQGTKVGASISGLRYKLGDSLKSIGAHGNASVASLWVSHPVIRSVDRNLYVRAGYDHKTFQDRIDTTGLNNERYTDSLSIEASGDVRDPLFGGAISTGSIGATAGRLKFRDAAAEAADASTARTAGNFTKVTGNLARTQTITSSSTLYLGLAGQWSHDNLDPSEQIVLGGPNSVRGYGVGTLSGATGYIGTAEFRQRLPAFQSRGTLMATAFVDSGWVKVYADPFNTNANKARLNGAGVGLNWAATEGWNARVDLAKPFGSTPALLGSRDSFWAWVQVGKSF